MKLVYADLTKSLGQRVQLTPRSFLYQPTQALLSANTCGYHTRLTVPVTGVVIQSLSTLLTITYNFMMLLQFHCMLMYSPLYLSMYSIS